MTINFYFEKPVTLRQRARLKEFIRSIFKQEGAKARELNYIFCDDKYLLNINRTFLKHDYYTDIITFDLSEAPGNITGEIYISTDRIHENARKFGVDQTDELHRVIFHGVLHLIGYKDKTAPQKKQMKAREEYYINKFRSYVPRGT